MIEPPGLGECSNAAGIQEKLEQIIRCLDHLQARTAELELRHEGLKDYVEWLTDKALHED